MARRKSESGQVEVPAESAPKQGKGAAAKKQPRTAGAKTAGEKAASGAKKEPDLRQDLRDFAAARPEGWSHEDWLNFLEHLQERGHNISDRDAIGEMLERERLAVLLEKVPGMGPQRVRTVADRFGYLWRLREADADTIAREANVPRALAEKVVEAVRG